MKKVLVVDDSHVSRLMVKAIIENGYPDWQVDVANDAREALQKCKSCHYDFISLDMNMPGMDGLAVAPQLIAACPGVKIALLTSNTQARVRDLAAKQGLVFISKPVTDDKVMGFLTGQV